VPVKWQKNVEVSAEGLKKQHLVSLGAAVVAGLAVGIALVIWISVMSAQPRQEDTSNRVWVAMDSKQCVRIEYAMPLVQRGVQIYDSVMDRWATEDMAFCAACGCADGNAYYFLIAESDLPTALSLGYRVESPPHGS
jgi:hypothetical protein